MLMDKGFYDYDYSEPKPHGIKSKTYDESVKSDDELRSILGRFGWGKPKESNPLTPSEIQAEVMAQEEKKRAVLG